MHIRVMEERDTEAVLEMMKVFYHSPAVIEKAPEAVLRRDIADCLSDMPYIEGFVLEGEQEIVGYGMAAKSYTTEYGGVCVWIEDLYIKPAHQGKGLATQFFNYIEKRYSGQMVRMRLDVHAENEHAVKSYEKNGFEKLDYMAMTKVFKKD